MKYWKYIVYAVLFTELIVFGENRSETWAMGALIVIATVAHILLSNNVKFKDGKKEIQRTNPLPKPVWNGVGVFLSLVCMIFPYLDGEINGLLVVLTVSMVSVMED